MERRGLSQYWFSLLENPQRNIPRAHQVFNHCETIYSLIFDCQEQARVPAVNVGHLYVTAHLRCMYYTWW